jgi:hypothetical protein
MSPGNQRTKHVDILEKFLSELEVNNEVGAERLTIKLDRLIVLSKSSLLGWFLHVSLIVIIKGRSPVEVSLIVIIKRV